jgi:hypothetical protein
MRSFITCTLLQVKEDEMGRACSMNGGRRRMQIGKPEGKRPLGRTRRRWVDNIKMDLREIGRDGMDWIDLAQDRDQWRVLVNTLMNLQVPENAGKYNVLFNIHLYCKLHPQTKE